MPFLLALLVFASFILGVIGLFKPNISLFWLKGIKSRKKSFLLYLVSFFFFIILLSVLFGEKKISLESQKITPTISTEMEVKEISNKPISPTLLDKPSELIKKLSVNGIGNLSQWKNPFNMGWGALTDYYQFGSENKSIGMKNNIAYYLEGTEKQVTKIYLNLNINNPDEKNNALRFLEEITRKTFRVLDLDLPDELSKAILNSKFYSSELNNYKISNELEKTKIETWKVVIERSNN